ncbi:MAG: c-type cytochrome biogenesis protein CcmI [Porticoccaceae bacterium]|nr:MAG: c-type cytochrome biogenesis protein CcmI [Porticoccaceae bacterium]
MMWLFFALLTLLAVAFVIYPLIKSAHKPAVDEVYGSSSMVVRANVILFQEQLAELDRQLEDGDIDTLQHAELVAEQKSLLLVDAPNESADLTPSSSTKNSTSESSVDESSISDSPSDKNPADLDSNKRNGRGAWLVMVCLLLTPLLAFSLYQMLGASDDVEITELLEKRASLSVNAEDHSVLSHKIQRKMSRRLLSDPDHMFYRVMLARLQMEEGNFSGASKDYQQAVRVSPNDVELLAEYAQALYFAAGNKFEGEVGTTLDNALALDPNNITALGLQGIRSFEAENYLLAITSWQAALRIIPSQSPQAQALQSGVLRARKLLGEELPTLSVNVSLSPDLEVQPGQTVYIFAREWQGRPMPLAVVKLLVEELPATVTLDDTMAMVGGQFLSSVAMIEVVARVSTTGSAIPSEGDLEGSTGELDMASHDKVVQVVIDHQL